MDQIITILKFAGIVTVSIIVILGLVFSVLQFLRGRKTETLKEVDSDILKQLLVATYIEPRMTLSLTNDEWFNHDKTLAMVNASRELGFISLGHYRMKENDQYQIHVMIDAKYKLVLVFYDLKSTPHVFFDLLTFYRDGFIACVSSIPNSEVSLVEGVQRWVHPHATLEFGIKFLLKNRPEGEAIVVDDESIIRVFEEKYAIQMDEMIRHKHPFDRRLEKVMAQLGDRISAELAEKMREQIRVNINHAIAEVSIDHFLKKSGLDVSKRDEICGEVEVIHEQMSVDLLWETFFKPYFIDRVFDSETKQMIEKKKVSDKVLERLYQAKKRFADDPLQYFERMNSAFPETKRFQKVGMIHYPLKAVIYQEPSVEESIDA